MSKAIIPETINLSEIGENAENFIKKNLKKVLQSGKESTDYKKDDKIQIHLIMKKTKSDNVVLLSKHYKWVHNPDGEDAKPSKDFYVVIPEDVMEKIAA